MLSALLSLTLISSTLPLCPPQEAPRAVTLDDEHPWVPVTDLAAWDRRRDELRRRVLVAAGLWPPGRCPRNGTRC